VRSILASLPCFVALEFHINAIFYEFPRVQVVLRAKVSDQWMYSFSENEKCLC